MKAKSLAAALLILGFTYYFLTYTPIESASNYAFNPDDLKSLDTGSLFLDIFLNNLMLGVLLSIGGYLTAGIITSLLLFWNGYLLAIVFRAGFFILTKHDILYYSKHLFIELPAFILFSEIGYKGFRFYKKMIVHKKIETLAFNDFKSFILPILLLIISAYLETL